jgi:hypothetical protein
MIKIQSKFVCREARYDREYRGHQIILATCSPGRPRVAFGLPLRERIQDPQVPESAKIPVGRAENYIDLQSYRRQCGAGQVGDMREKP